MKASRDLAVIMDGHGAPLANGIGHSERPWDGHTGLMHELPACFVLIDEASPHAEAPHGEIDRIVGLPAGCILADSPAVLSEIVSTLDAGRAVAIHTATEAQIEAAVQSILRPVGGGHA